ncbi:GNAT family N-acetyltransferase [Chitinimonas arctica]|uniref:GNAT family N-acetyltransferase n=1 Tax=Chitinimonas arctica TaxID=2594795 RepID=A0A516SHY4_9NEIS|nr:GNAT family N-acetyltransferase [Chitinimonas arctica]QDQ27772.1 GNAT family N-acetyltransferase [Chitinimonas arctica]
MHILHLNAHREIVEPVWLARAETIHRQLRPQMGDYASTMAGIVADGGEMMVAVEGEAVLGLAVFRTHRNTFAGRTFYVDDLVTDATRRSQGVGRLMLNWLQEEARQRGATRFMLDSGTQRTEAHRFYFREGMVIGCFNFEKSLDPR